jgi:hypothetical protein
MIFLSLLLLLFAIFLRGNRQLSARNVSAKFGARPKRQIWEQDDLPFISGFVVAMSLKENTQFRAEKLQ